MKIQGVIMIVLVAFISYVLGHLILGSTYISGWVSAATCMFIASGIERKYKICK